MELLKEIVPRLSRVAVFVSSTSQDYAQALKETELAAGAFGVKLQYLDVPSPKDVETAFRAAGKGGLTRSFSGAGPFHQFSATTDCSTRGKKPAPGDIRRGRICGSRGAYELRREHYRLGPARRYVCGQDFERRKARRSPVEQPKKFEFIINLKAAKQIGLTIPPNVLVRADQSDQVTAVRVERRAGTGDRSETT